MSNSKTFRQTVPLILTVIILGVLLIVLYFYLNFMNLIPFGEAINLTIRPLDFFVGMTIYLKTSIDFAIFMGRLMAANPGWKNRIALEIGTALGNTLGTMVVILLWVLFKNIDLLLALMIFLASLVLFQLAYDGLEHSASWQKELGFKRNIFLICSNFLLFVKGFTDPLLKRIIPHLSDNFKGKKNLSWGKLFTFSFTIPFILGLDDFAGYVPLFSVIKVFGFASGVLAAHTLLNIALFVSPKKTISVVKNETFSFLGTIAFIGLAFWGLFEVSKIILRIII